MAKVIGKREMVIDCINLNCRSVVVFDWSEVERKNNTYGENGKYIKCPECGCDILIEAEWNGKPYWRHEIIKV